MSSARQFFTGGGLKPPTQFDFVIANPAINTTTVDTFALQQSSTITSTTLTEVLNISGSGVLTYASISVITGQVTNGKMKITVDGVVALDETQTVGSVQTMKILGVAEDAGGSAGFSSSEPICVFNKSLVVEIAGDGVDGLIFYHKKYLT